MLPVRTITGINTRSELRDYIVRHGCYSQEENLRIYEKWFAAAPRYLFRAVDRKYGLTQKVLCDVGCSYGMNLLFCVPGSYGIEIDGYAVAFARSLGLTVYQRDVLNDDLSDLPKVEAIWCSAVLEHVDSPHMFLRKLHLLLKPAWWITGSLCAYNTSVSVVSSVALCGSILFRTSSCGSCQRFRSFDTSILL